MNWFDYAGIIVSLIFAIVAIYIASAGHLCFAHIFALTSPFVGLMIAQIPHLQPVSHVRDSYKNRS